MPNPGDVVTISGCPCCSSSSSSSSSSSGGCADCLCCTGLSFAGVSSTTCYGGITNLGVGEFNVLSPSNGPPCTRYDLGSSSVAFKIASSAFPVVITATINSSFCSGNTGTYTKNDSSTCIYGTYSLTAHSDVNTTWPATIRVYNYFFESVLAGVNPTSITVDWSGSPSCIWAGGSSSVTLINTGANFPCITGYQYARNYSGNFIGAVGDICSMKLTLSCGLMSNFYAHNITDPCSGDVIIQNSFQVPFVTSGTTVIANNDSCGHTFKTGCSTIPMVVTY